MLASFTVFFDAEAILIAVGVCAVATIALTFFAFQTKYDFTTCGGMLCSLVFILIISGILMACFSTRDDAMHKYVSSNTISIEF